MESDLTINRRFSQQDRNALKVLFGGMLGMVVAMGIGRFVFTPILPLMQRDLGMSNSVAGWLAGLNYLGYLGGAIICFIAPQLLRFRLVSGGALLLSIVTTMFMGITLSVFWWGILRFGGGAASAILFIVISAEVAESLTRRGYGHWVGALYGGIGIGIALSGLIVPQLDQVGGWSGSWIGVGAIAAILAISGIVIGRKRDLVQPVTIDTSCHAGGLHSLWFLAIAYFLEGLGYIVTATFLVAIIAVTPGLEAFAPLSRLAGDLFATWADMLPALLRVWNNLCPDEPLEENKEKSDIKEAARLLDQLKADADLLPAVGLSGFSADLGRMLAAKSVAPHRGKAKPVVVAGTVEARLEKFDHLFLAGMAEGSFPARSRRPLFLNTNLRRQLNLPDWRESLARDAALFLRLLFNAPQVLVTWPTEGDGRPILPSPFVARLALALPDGREPDRAAVGPLWRRSDEEIPATKQLQAQFEAEGLVPVCTEKIRPLNKLSWSALRTWRECPYRYLLARGFQLQKED